MKEEKIPEILISDAQVTDCEVIAAFQQKMALETENLQLDPATLAAGVKAVFDHPEHGRYFVAKANNRIIASMMTTYEWSDWRNASVWWLQSVYVLPAYRGTGIFRKLYDHVRELAREQKQVAGIRLYVDKHNVQAQKVYEAVGMDGEHYRVFEWMKEG